MHSRQIDSQVADAPLRRFSVGDGDPDRPFSFTDYVAIASSVRHRGRCEVWSEALPYGMWWQELRPTIELRIGNPPADTEPLGGVWTDAERWLACDDDGYRSAAATFRRVAWLGETGD